ncbi:MAG: PAS domain-containing protein [Candidatus Delongbacteria bacterium]|nr:PAS domain-containing protein [Candidatus Cloacimonadota bacterium]MCB9472887.1 PAS domain-containing protein [Candidatus Delongbacteria bacterium]
MRSFESRLEDPMGVQTQMPEVLDSRARLTCVLVDVQAEAIRNTTDSLLPYGVTVLNCSEFDELDSLIAEFGIHAVMCDIQRLQKLPPERLSEFRENHPTLPIILLGNPPIDPDEVERRLRHGGDEFHQKPVIGLNLDRVLRNQIRRRAEDMMLQDLEQEASKRLMSNVLQAKREFEEIFDALPWPLLLADRAGVVRRANLATVANDSGAIRRIVGRALSPALRSAGQRAAQLDEMVRERLQDCSPVEAEGLGPVFEHGELFSWPLHGPSGESNGTVHLLVDRTQIHRLEFLLQEQEKQSTIGLLASGMAHNLSSPLQAIQGKLQLLEMINGPNDDMTFLYNVTSRMQDIVSSFMYKLRRDREPRTTAVDINALILSELKVLEANLVFKHEISCQTELDPLLEPVPAIHGDISQALTNVINNAVDAMHGCKRKELTIRTVHGGEGYSRIHIIDTGRGIPLEIREKIWDSFFTTKPLSGEAAPGEPSGTGLGLASSRFLLNKHGIGIDFSSTVGVGTEFIISWRRSS